MLEVEDSISMIKASSKNISFKYIIDLILSLLIIVDNPDSVLLLFANVIYCYKSSLINEFIVWVIPVFSYPSNAVSHTVLFYSNKLHKFDPSMSSITWLDSENSLGICRLN